MVKAEYISCKRDILGDIEEIEIRETSTGKHKRVTPDQIVKAVQAGLIEIKYIKVSSDGVLHITKKSKFTIGDKIKELEAEIKRLDKSTLPSDRDIAIKKSILLQRLEAEKYKFKKYVASDYK